MSKLVVDETKIVLVINGDAISMPLKEAERLYQRLKVLFEPNIPQGDLFNPHIGEARKR